MLFMVYAVCVSYYSVCTCVSIDTNLPAEHVRSDAAGGDGAAEGEVPALQIALDTDDTVGRGVEAAGRPDGGHLQVTRLLHCFFRRP